jgi:outer membrane protein TolC
MGAVARPAYSLSLALALVVAVAGCGSIHLDGDPDIAPAANVDRIWIPSQSVRVAHEATPQLEELRNVGESNGLQGHNAEAYDLPALVDLALRISPQTRSAWYAAQAAQAQLGQSHAGDYPKADVEGEGGYLKLPLEFPGRTLVIRNEAFLPQIKVSYDLLDFGRTRAAQRGAREQLIAANFAFNRAIQDVVFNVEKAY